MKDRQPFSYVAHADFLARAADLEGDEIALFTIAFFLMLERRGPIDDDMRWLGRRAGISGTRRANQIRLKLIDQGKWQARGGQIGDPAALAIVERQNKRSAINSSNAMARWERAGQPEFDLEAPADDNSGTQDKKRRKSPVSRDAIASSPASPAAPMQTGAKNGEKTDLNARTNGLNLDLIGQDSAENRQSAPEFCIADSRARATPHLDPEEDSTTDHESLTRERTLPQLLALISDASGFRPAEPDQIDNALGYVKAWRDVGADFELTVLPTIRRLIADDSDPTSSLKRFDRHVRHEHARVGARPKGNGKPLEQAGPDAPDPRIERLRTDLRRETPARAYDGWLRPITFTLDGTALIATLPSQFMADWVLNHFAEIFRTQAERHGFSEIRIHGPPT
jgi:hypothetical protein